MLGDSFRWVAGCKNCENVGDKIYYYYCAYILCSSCDTRVSCGWCLLIQDIVFVQFKTMQRKCLAQVSKLKITGGNHAFLTDNLISFNLEKNPMYIAFILKLFTNIVDQLYLKKNVWLHPIFTLDFNKSLDNVQASEACEP